MDAINRMIATLFERSQVVGVVVVAIHDDGSLTFRVDAGPELHEHLPEAMHIVAEAMVHEAGTGVTH